ncbi:hypothetical protein BGX38DRAFT_1207226 [Terfezia claveryi]|nr:hypothetical protein BGX38DRAFT_1207226 [Terfezia claveryi]
MHVGSTGKRHRLASQVVPLLKEELNGRWFSYGNFFTDFVHHEPWALSDTKLSISWHFYAGIHRLEASLMIQQAIVIAICHQVLQTQCSRPSSVIWGMPFFACPRLPNASLNNHSTATSTLRATIPMIGGCLSLVDPTAQCPNKPMQENLPGSPDLAQSLYRPGGLSWVSYRTSALQDLGNPWICPDFVLTNNSITPTWSILLVVGEHHSAGKNEDAGKLQPASCAE